MAALSQYAVLLRDAAPPSAEAVRRAFGTFSHLTDADAIRLAANAQGILQRHLSVDEAKALQRALQVEGVSAALVKEEELHFLPPSQLLHRIELTPGALGIFDLYGRLTAVPWADLTMIAAGAVPHFEVSASQAARSQVRFHPVFGRWPQKPEATRSRLETERQMILELVIGTGRARYELLAHQFPFNQVLNLPTAALAEKFLWLVGELIRRAPQAALGRGAGDVRDGIQLVRGYPSRQLLEDEMVWLLWNRRQSSRP